jgi:predicted nucleotidyltransferase
MLTKEKILDTLKDMKQELSRSGVSSIGLFGSYVKNSQKPESDIDLLVDFLSGKETFDNFMDVCHLLENTFKNYKVEIVTKNGLSKHIGSYILEETEYV